MISQDRDCGSVPLDAVEQRMPYGNGYRGLLDLRRKAVRDAEHALLDLPIESGPEMNAVAARARVHGQAIVQQLWTLLVALEAHEQAVTHLHEELAWTRERVSDIPEFRYDEPPCIAQARYGIEKLRSQLGKELRDRHEHWLETRAEAEERIQEQFVAYSEVLGVIETAAGQLRERVTLAMLMRFLNEPPPSDVIVLTPGSCEDVVGGVRIP